MRCSQDLSLEPVHGRHSNGGEGSLLSAEKPAERGAAPLLSLYPNPVQRW